ncbi:DUF1636 family protein [Phaeobacter gallaeciensis]|uniref:Metal-binding protein n=1 Tax=Phaeobacter gallaeciensis TaxID=60890 RepID=A0AAC9Z6Q8_9RHOB|nr:DUF1636 domain-containing protein [Phaeobacter gallaeciensis]AHD08526.1 putative metal-binding protein [Phaeobacter gallaeciensis DSM 26640]ATE91792.1 putative metal-binding protein [Phaeobacter gallaeciensis]ATE98384.1 putative metal-binding protein [Phaeobacter gallaeciensis]ATF00408.1 putative metal-binding protein [Phaeobacter gallaeciensis]ATF04840.1 putative metal-binding protein [Phaeobacter gallaeciensis]
MDGTARHRILVCTSCKGTDPGTRPGSQLIGALRDELDRRGDTVVEVAGVACMAGCSHPCTVGFQAEGKASYVFGDLNLQDDLADILHFADLYKLLADGWCSSIDRPGKLRRSTLSRIPALLPTAPMPAQAAKITAPMEPAE